MRNMMGMKIYGICPSIYLLWYSKIIGALRLCKDFSLISDPLYYYSSLFLDILTDCL